MERVLFIWAIRHPASGYVQGLNDLICPFMMVFFSEHVRHGEKFENIEMSEVPESAMKQVMHGAFFAFQPFCAFFLNIRPFTVYSILLKGSCLFCINFEIEHEKRHV